MLLSTLPHLQDTREQYLANLYIPVALDDCRQVLVLECHGESWRRLHKCYNRFGIYLNLYHTLEPSGVGDLERKYKLYDLIIKFMVIGLADDELERALGRKDEDEEKNETPAYVKISIEDQNGNIIRHLNERARKGTHRITWDLRHMFRGSVTDANKKYNMRGPIVKPGKYSATLYLVESGSTTKLSEKKSFELKPIYKSTLKGTSFEDYDK